MKLRPSRIRRQGRIEIIPMIDVMFFLLATFMLASLAMQNLHALRVDLPRGTAQALSVSHPVTLTVTADSRLLINETAVSLDQLPDELRVRLGGQNSVIVNADAAAPNGVVVRAMVAARSAGVEKFDFAIRRE
jgi:biopolymer transport protein ExbD